MTRFIWVKDRDGSEHYLNVASIARVTKVPAKRDGHYGGYSYIRTNSGEDYSLINEKGYDTYEDIISKIQVALA